jgi:hypothetical protein
MRYAVLVGIILISLPLLWRLHLPEQFPDASSYEALRQSELHGEDTLYGTPHYTTLSDLLFSYVHPQLALILLAAITLFALSIYYSDEIFILLFATSPAFIYAFTRVHEAALGITLIAVGLMLIEKKQYWAVLLIPVCFSLDFSIGVLASLTFIAVALVRNMPFVALGSSFFALVSGTVAALFVPLDNINTTLFSFQEALGLVTSVRGVTIFLIALGAIGFIILYTRERKLQQLLVLLLIPCALFFEYGGVIIAGFLALFGSRAWEFLSTRRWHFEELRALTLLLIACGILFTTLVVERERFTLNEPRAEATQFITTAYPEGTLIAAPQDIAPILAYEGNPTIELTDQSANTLRRAGVQLVVVKEDDTRFNRLILLYHGINGYNIYTFNQ